MGWNWQTGTLNCIMSPDGSTDDHGHGTELECPAPTDPIGNGAAEQAADESSSQADADH
jgi:hypothetical protein